MSAAEIAELKAKSSKPQATSAVTDNAANAPASTTTKTAHTKENHANASGGTSPAVNGKSFAKVAPAPQPAPNGEAFDTSKNGTGVKSKAQRLGPFGASKTADAATA